MINIFNTKHSTAEDIASLFARIAIAYLMLSNGHPKASAPFSNPTIIGCGYFYQPFFIIVFNGIAKKVGNQEIGQQLMQYYVKAGLKERIPY